MQKDVVYIDVEDDITAVVGKLKSAKHKIVALVPPKRVGILQSAVNVRLLARAAEQNNKRVVIITGNEALSSLAASANIPVAKNLQSRPELAPVAALAIDDDDIIDGGELPVGEHAAQAATDDSPVQTATSLGAAAALASEATTSVKKATPTSKKQKNKIPNFDTFRKKLLLIGGGLVLLIGLLVWAIFFAPHATVILSARTTDFAVSQQLTMSPSLETSQEKSTMKVEAKTTKTDVSADGSATGSKDIGEKATGSVRFATDAVTILTTGLTVPAGTTVKSSSGAEYSTTEAAVFAKGDAGALAGVTVGVTAKAAGTSYNGASGNASTSAQNIAWVKFVETTSGGTDKTVKVAKASDITTATEAAQKQADEAAAKTELASQFGDEYVVFDSEIIVDQGDIKASVSAGDEVDSGTFKVSGTVTYTMYAIKKDAINSYLESVVGSQIDDGSDQRIYDSGIDAVQFTNLDMSDKNVLSGTLSTNAKVGPNISDDYVKSTSAGKRFGEIQAELQGKQGIDSVDVKFSPFWVNTAPKNTDKISVEFTVDG